MEVIIFIVFGALILSCFSLEVSVYINRKILGVVQMRLLSSSVAEN